MENYNEVIGKRIKNIRINRGMSQEEFGKLIGNAHKSLVSKWELGKSLPNNERLKIIAELTGMTANEFLSSNIKKDSREVYNQAIDRYLMSQDIPLYTKSTNEEIYNNIFQLWYKDNQFKNLSNKKDLESIFYNLIQDFHESEKLKLIHTEDDLMKHIDGTFNRLLNDLKVYKESHKHYSSKSEIKYIESILYNTRNMLSDLYKDM